MKILHPDSLIETVEAFNRAVCFEVMWQAEAAELIAWVSQRLGQPGAYAGSFALTESDWSRPFRLFTGEPVTTRAARAHIIAEETTRMLRLIALRGGPDGEARKVSEQRLRERIYGRADHRLEEEGIYCCGTCSVAFWRALVGGAFPEDKSTLSRAAETLARSRDGRGGWRRFPFFYTLWLLSEADRDLMRDEVEYCAKRGTGQGAVRAAVR